MGKHQKSSLKVCKESSRLMVHIALFPIYLGLQHIIRPLYRVWPSMESCLVLCNTLHPLELVAGLKSILVLFWVLVFPQTNFFAHHCIVSM
jgi:hypothetical protein